MAVGPVGPVDLQILQVLQVPHAQPFLVGSSSAPPGAPGPTATPRMWDLAPVLQVLQVLQTFPACRLLLRSHMSYRSYRSYSHFQHVEVDGCEYLHPLVIVNNTNELNIWG